MDNAEREQPRRFLLTRAGFPLHGWLGLILALSFWAINWSWDGLRTQWAFFPMWLGYCLTMDALVFWRTGTSLLTRDWRKYVGLFVISAPVWWAFEALNVRTQNWTYLGVDGFSSLEYAFWTTLSFSTVVPAVFGSAEFLASFGFLRRVPRGPILRPDKLTTLTFFLAGWLMLALLLLRPQIFFPFIWLSPYFIIEPLNIWLGHRSLADWTRTGNWRPVIALWLGVWMTAFFWEMWNFLSYPKWIYHVPWGGWLHIFEMPLLGYGGYLPFALELFAFYHLIMGMLGRGKTDYVQVDPDRAYDREQNLSMPSNIEIKARARDFKGIRSRAEAMADMPVEVISQEDTFFIVSKGRLKLRVRPPNPAQLIYYERRDQDGPKRSDYHIFETTDPDHLKRTLSRALGVRGLVRKTRYLYIVGQTRVHVDDVQDLGQFMELEVVMRPGQSDSDGQAIAEDLMFRLGVEPSDLLEGAYMDLIEERQKGTADNS